MSFNPTVQLKSSVFGPQIINSPNRKDNDKDKQPAVTINCLSPRIWKKQKQTGCVTPSLPSQSSRKTTSFGVRPVPIIKGVKKPWLRSIDQQSLTHPTPTLPTSPSQSQSPFVQSLNQSHHHCSQASTVSKTDSVVDYLTKRLKSKLFDTHHQQSQHQQFLHLQLSPRKDAVVEPPYAVMEMGSPRVTGPSIGGGIESMPISHIGFGQTFFNQVNNTPIAAAAGAHFRQSLETPLKDGVNADDATTYVSYSLASDRGDKDKTAKVELSDKEMEKFSEWIRSETQKTLSTKRLTEQVLKELEAKVQMEHYLRLKRTAIIQDRTENDQEEQRHLTHLQQKLLPSVMHNIGDIRSSSSQVSRTDLTGQSRVSKSIAVPRQYDQLGSHRIWANDPQFNHSYEFVAQNALSNIVSESYGELDSRGADFDDCQAWLADHDTVQVGDVLRSQQNKQRADQTKSRWVEELAKENQRLKQSGQDFLKGTSSVMRKSGVYRYKSGTPCLQGDKSLFQKHKHLQQPLQSSLCTEALARFNKLQQEQQMSETQSTFASQNQPSFSVTIQQKTTTEKQGVRIRHVYSVDQNFQIRLILNAFKCEN